MKRAAEAESAGDDKRARPYNALRELDHGGIPLEWIKQHELVDKFGMICVVCRNCIYKPVATRCGHVMCGTCHAQSMQAQEGEKLCPVCRSDDVEEDEGSCKLMQRMVNALVVRCPNKVNDPSAACAWEGPVGDLGAHLEKACADQTIECPHCSALQKRTTLPAHVLECPRAPKHCVACDMMVPSLETHLCSAAEIVCALCGLSYRRMHALQHRERVCTAGEIACPLAATCCEHKAAFATRAEMEGHLREHAVPHAYDAADRIKELRKQLSEARDHLSGIQALISDDMIVSIVRSNHVVALQAVRYMGFNINDIYGGVTLLGIAVGHGQVEMVEALIADRKSVV